MKRATFFTTFIFLSVISHPAIAEPVVNKEQDLAIKTEKDYLILDLGEKGISYRKQDQNQAVYFDWDSDNYSVASDWIGPEDGFLLHYTDALPVRKITGHHFFNSLGGHGKSLKVYDLNSDGFIDKLDKIWKEIFIWQDKNSDAFVQSDEVKTLEEMGVMHISLSDGQLAFPDGLSAFLEIFQPLVIKQNSRFSGDVKIAFETLFLPELRGFSKIPDLRIALSVNEELKNKIIEICTTKPEALFKENRELIESLHYLWANIGSNDQGARGPNIDARKIDFLENYFGIKYYNEATGNPNPGKNAAAALQDMWEQLTNKNYYKIIAQCHGENLFKTEIVYDLRQDKAVPVDKIISPTTLENFVNLEKKIQPERPNEYWDLVLGLLTEIYGEKAAKIAMAAINK